MINNFNKFVKNNKIINNNLFFKILINQISKNLLIFENIVFEQQYIKNNCIMKNFENLLYNKFSIQNTNSNLFKKKIFY